MFGFGFDALSRGPWHGFFFPVNAKVKFPSAFALEISVFHFRRLMANSRHNNNEEQCSEAGDGRIPHYFPRG